MSMEGSGGVWKPADAFRAFSDSSYGEALSGSPRWSMHLPEHVSPEQWINLIGREADNLQHMRVSYQTAQAFFRFDDGSLNVSEEEKSLLLFAASIHDIGKTPNLEMGIGGDIAYELKTAEDREKELTQYRAIYDEMFGEMGVKQKHIVESVIYDKDSKLGEIFSAIEKTGYIRTAKIAYELSKNTDDEVLKSYLEWLTIGTLTNQTITLMEYSANFTPVRRYLEHIAPFIDEAFATLDPSLFKEHGQGQIEKVNLFNQAKVVWKHGFFHAPELTSTTDTNMFSPNPNFNTRFVEDYSELEKKIAACRELGLKIVLTSGSFDLIHIGHARYVEKAKQHGDILVVGVDSDAKIQKRKGPDRPIVEEDERLQMLSHLRGVDLITLKQPDDKKWELIRIVHPDILIATAETYTPEEIAELENGYCTRVVVLEPQATTSTSARIRRLNIGGLKELMKPILQEIEEGAEPDVIKERIKNVIEQ